MKGKIKKVISLLLVLSFCVTGCAGSNENVPDEYKSIFKKGSFDENQIWTGSNKEYAELIEELKKCCEESAIGSVMVATDKEIIFSGGWNALEVDGETVVNPFTTYEIGSVTKQFVAAAILQQVQKGKLSTSDTLDKFFPEYPHASQITIDHLLHMDSGIPDYINESFKFFVGRTPEELEDFMTGEMTDEKILEYLYKTELNFEPGKRYRYSCTNYYLLALILEQITGETYEEYMKKNIFDVCKMENSTCTETGNITSVPQGNGAYLAMGRTCRGSGDIHSNVCDILLWNRALMSGKIIDKTQLQYMTELRNGYSCGWFEIGNGAIGHDGATEGYVAVNIVYQHKGQNLYFIMMVPDAGKVSLLGKVSKVVEKHLEE